MDHPWTLRKRPERLERRIEFADYEQTREFLEQLNSLSEQQSRYPDISFGRTYVNLTIAPESGEEITEADHQLGAQIDSQLAAS